jgi:hypothetical protein
MRLAVNTLDTAAALAGAASAAVLAAVLLTRRARRRRDTDAKARAEDSQRVQRRLDRMRPAGPPAP